MCGKRSRLGPLCEPGDAETLGRAPINSGLRRLPRAPAGAADPPRESDRCGPGPHHRPRIALAKPLPEAAARDRLLPSRIDCDGGWPAAKPSRSVGRPALSSPRFGAVADLGRARKFPLPGHNRLSLRTRRLPPSGPVMARKRGWPDPAGGRRRLQPARKWRALHTDQSLMCQGDCGRATWSAIGKPCRAPKFVPNPWSAVVSGPAVGDNSGSRNGG
jgi:hypothetical protein